MTQEKFRDKKSKDYRKHREAYGIKDPVYLDEIEEAYYQGMVDADKYPRWISVNDELPPTSDKDDKSDDYLTVDSDGDKNVGYYNKMDELWFSCDGYILDVTHWMPLPQAPKEGGKE